MSQGVRRSRLLFALFVASTIMVSACGSDGGSAAPVPSSADISSVSVAPGVEKDSVLDLNSTKDMTGVVTTVPIGKSPYDKNMPDICGFITQDAMGELGVESKKKGFTGSPLVVQTCLLTPINSGMLNTSISIGAYVNNLAEHLSVPNLQKVLPGPLQLSKNIQAYELRDTNFNGVSNLCEIAWGTFYGTAAVRVRDDNSGRGLCDRALDAARIISPLMPRSPSQMRPTS